MATKQTTLDDLVRQVSRLIGTVNSVLERYARLAEEYDSNRLATEEIRELLKELIEEIGRSATQLGRDINRLEEYVILKGMGKGNSPKSVEITQEVSSEHLERSLRKRLADQQKLLRQYEDNITKVQLQIARMGYETIENANKLTEYQEGTERARTAIERLREAFKMIEGNR